MLPWLFFVEDKEKKPEEVEVIEPIVEPEPVIEPVIEKKVEVHVDVDSHKEVIEKEVKAEPEIPEPIQANVSFPLYDIEPSDNREDNPERPPKTWFDTTYANIKRQYPKYKPERLRKITGGIWYGYPESTKRALWSRHEGQQIRRSREREARRK